MESTLASIILTKYTNEEDTNEYGFSYSLPISKINDVSVNAFLEINNLRKSIIFYVNSKIIIKFSNQQYFKYYISSDSTIINYEYTIEDFIEAINKVQELLPIMKFDKLIGRFSTDSTSEQEKQCVEALFNTSNVTLIYENCSVCQECTTTKTKCGHSLCFPCWEKIKRTEETDHESTYEHQICPVCRAIINTRQLNIDCP